jgi:hypothetical protein
MVEPKPSLPFLVTGLPKSGTTFLQRLLNLHPGISCPSEQSFAGLASVVEEMLRQYRAGLQLIDRRTGGQGASEYGATVRDEMLRAAIATLSKSFARGRPIHGLNDNSVFDEIERYDNLLGHPKVVAIVRNPVDVGLSAWRHFRRLAREEPRMARTHLGLLDNPKNSIEGYIEKIAPLHGRQVDAFLAYAAGRPNMLVVRYEQLVAAKESEVPRLLEFLGASRSEDVIARMVAGSSRQAMASGSKVPAFFGLDPNDPDRAAVSTDFRRATLEAAMTPRLARIGYDVPSLMVGH